MYGAGNRTTMTNLRANVGRYSPDPPQTPSKVQQLKEITYQPGWGNPYTAKVAISKTFSYRRKKKHKHNTSSPYFVMLSFKNYISFSTGSIFKSFKLLIWLTLRLSTHHIWLSVPQMNPMYTYNPSVAHIRIEWITLTINSASSAIWVSGFYQIMIIIFSHFFFF